MNRSLGALVGIAQGLLADRRLTDQEVQFLHDWLEQNDVIATVWPGDVVFARIRHVLEDGVITEAERSHLIDTLQKLVGGELDKLAELTHVTELALDNIDIITIRGSRICMTGDCVFGPRSVCRSVIEELGGIWSNSVTKKLNYLVIGGLGSDEWKYGSFGTKVEKAMQYKRAGAPILIIHEDSWAASL